MKKYIYVLLATLLLGLVSCDSSFNNYKRSRAKVDKLLSERKYEKAREVANNVGSAKVKEELLSSISYTQINMLMEDGDYETASELARELQMEDLFYDAFFKDIRKVIKRGNYDFVFETLMAWQCPYVPQMIVDDYPKYFGDGRYTKECEKRNTGKDCTPGEYNYLMRKVNDATDVVLQKVMFEGYAPTIRRCLMCYRPYSVYTKKNEKIGKELNKYTNDYMHRYYFEMQNTAKADAKKLLLEADVEY